MICEDVIKSYLEAIQGDFHCRETPSGRFSILTPYLYPDHDNIEVSVRLKNGNEIVASDMGETLRRLDTLGLDVMNTPDAFSVAQRIAEGFGASVQRGALVKRGPIDSIGSLVFDVVAACQSVSSLVYGAELTMNSIEEPEGMERPVLRRWPSEHPVLFGFLMSLLASALTLSLGKLVDAFLKHHGWL